jgi:hypothetical protein
MPIKKGYKGHEKHQHRKAIKAKNNTNTKGHEG